ncbi:hypothetical protein [Duganella sp. LjRoot269]|uniref:hypothetical protein n=1 Tax=Duganella sp. LjRoot269 TaxID=3342305 RepID=UPI003F50733B
MRLTKSLKAAIRRAGSSIGDLEALAGIPGDETSRSIFWLARRAEVKDRTGAENPDPALVFDRGREVCYSLVEWRVSAGELCILRAGPSAGDVALARQ